MRQLSGENQEHGTSGVMMGHSLHERPNAKRFSVLAMDCYRN